MSDEVDIDNEHHDDLDHEAPSKPSLKEAWQSNPLLKIAAAVIVLAVVVAGYMTLTKPNPVDESKSIVAGAETGDIKSIPGQGELDKKYRESIEQKNEQNAKTAAAAGTSAIPISVSTAKTQAIEVPQASGATDTDPLQEWKQTLQSKSIKNEQAPREEESAPQSDLVPMVQPVRPQAAAMKMDPKAADALSQQMRTIIATQVPPKATTVGVTLEESLYEIAKKEKDKQKAAAATGAATTAATTAAQEAVSGKVIVPAGTIAYAQLLTELNSDVPGPALATVLSGPFEGGRALGQMSAKDDYIVITFTRIIKDAVSYSINGIALDEATTLPAQQTSIDHHYFTRIILPAAAKFVSGYGQDLSQTGTASQTTSGGGVVQDTPKPSAKESAYKGLSAATDEASQVIQEDAKNKPTIRVARGTTMGILFLDPVKTTSAEK